MMNFCVVLLVIFVITLGLLVSSVPHYGPKRNVIIMISDGFGPASESYGRAYAHYLNSSTYGDMTPLDKILVGQSRTRSSSSLITDSAAGATAFSCAMKSYNGAVGVDPFKKPCGTILEAAKKEGFLTGLVATSRVTHATPAAFSAHVPHRDMESEIAEQQLGFYPLGRNVDLMLGGGKCFFEPKTNNGSCRLDDRDLIKEGKDNGWKFITSRQEFDHAQYKPSLLPLAGLFADGHMDYEIDRNPSAQPSLREMSRKALDILEKATLQSSQGFFLMIEGSRIDMAAHSNDPVAHASDILAYYEAVSAVREFVSTHPDTIMISVSDHETGGFTVGRQVTKEYPEYIWYPEVVARVKKSSFEIARQVLAYSGNKKEEFLREKIAKEYMGMSDVTDAELKGLNSTDLETVADTVSEMVSFRAQVGWTTHGHTAVDVNLYAHGNQIDGLLGNHENTDIGVFMANYLHVDLNSTTKRLSTWERYSDILKKAAKMSFSSLEGGEAAHHDSWWKL
ncbi:vacuolar alkaline phosphatase [Entomophthora muscae]|uniref:Vacuolar alkaline phosphatase n=1 Tax=Entomophthora muscae TaxID=34485 RepID=A0ACC2TBN0_9FUNG|nr:vacuolar alkaline phosphatase [Entomophthora muscae]